MAPQAVQPLRIQKGPLLSSSPGKLDQTSPHRPLAEVGLMERRRNSPSFIATPASQKDAVRTDSSPFDPYPELSAVEAPSPRLFWQGQGLPSPSRFGSENSPHGYRDGSPSPTRRSSLEKLKAASRVKNSKMFAREHKQEYDPTVIPTIERPLAGGRPLSTLGHTSASGGRDVEAGRPDASRFVKGKPLPLSGEPTTSAFMGHRRSLATTIPVSGLPDSPSKEKASPTKSSLSNRYATNVGSLEHEKDVWSEEDSTTERQLPAGRVLHRQAKSVTFDAGPPQVNEYERTTPELSSVGSASRESSYDSAGDTVEDEGDSREESAEREDSFDPRLEDVGQTPVMGPDDWRLMSPDAAMHYQVPEMSGVFDGDDRSPAPAEMPASLQGGQHAPGRTDSNGSTASHRPLPPLPAVNGPRSSPRSLMNLAGGAERRNSVSSLLRSPAGPAAVSKAEILDTSGCSLTLEQRMRLMFLQDSSGHEDSKDEPSIAQTSTQDYTSAQEEHVSSTSVERPATPVYPGPHMDAPPHADDKPAPRISRESILRRVKSQSRFFDESELNFSSPLQSSTPERSVMSDFDPDEPLPSTEDSNGLAVLDSGVAIKQEPDSELEMSSADYYESRATRVAAEEPLGDGSVLHHQVHRDEDDEHSVYSQASQGKGEGQGLDLRGSDDDGATTPTQARPGLEEPRISETGVTGRMSLPEFASLLGDDDLGFGLESFMSATNEVQPESPKLPEEPLPSKHQAVERPVTPAHQLLPPALPHYDPEPEMVEGTPESVVHHPIVDNDDDDDEEAEKATSPPSAEVPERTATIKAPGGRLKTRPSATPADLAAMAATRRQVSGELPRLDPAPPIPERHRNRPSVVPETTDDVSTMSSVEAAAHGAGHGSPTKSTRRKSGRKSLVKLDVRMDEAADDLSLGLDREFDRVLETQKRGYLMRQNTKVIVASSNAHADPRLMGELPSGTARGSRSAGNSPRKTSREPRPQSWAVEPWRSGTRRKSIRDGSLSPKKKAVAGPVPPLPGKESNVSQGLTSVLEDHLALEPQHEPGAERGRLFVKVLGVKDLQLPAVRGQQSWFNVTLDNGIHCVQTAWLELGKNAPIGQEFELIVMDDLEFTLTLQTEAPQAPAPTPMPSPVKSVKTPKSSTFSRLLASPKKRREMEKKQHEEEARAAQRKLDEAQALRASAVPSAWELLHHLVAADGTFARAYFSLKEHEARAYGRPAVVEIDCFNEWATEPARLGGGGSGGSGSGSAKSQPRSGDGPRRAPYRIGQLELQLLFVPKPGGAADSAMPKSLNACVRELAEAEAHASRQCEGHLSQQGGDCPYWRRRYFKLHGSRLTAYHETTRQPRATISLAKATKLIDDRSTLLQKEVTARGGGRRRSGFAEEEEGYMFVEEGFRIRFGNGEIIDFYADNAADKDRWMKVLADTVGRASASAAAAAAGAGLLPRPSWTDLVLARERRVGTTTTTTAAAAMAPAADGPHATAAAAAPPSAPSGSGVMLPPPPPPPPPPRQLAPLPPAPRDTSPRRPHHHHHLLHQQQQQQSAERTPQLPAPRRTQPAPRSMIF
ncbi:MAG: Bud site selection protein bud4 [Phylliscum demangeonii]|nr:MAG: Bud site selection protein bud4 [Phylliscum demangeonii]